MGFRNPLFFEGMNGWSRADSESYAQGRLVDWMYELVARIIRALRSFQCLIHFFA